MQAAVAGAFEEELRGPAEEENAGGAERELSEPTRLHQPSAGHQHMDPNPGQQLQRKRQQFRRPAVLVRARLTTTNSTAAQSTGQHTHQLTNRNSPSPHERLPSQFQRLVV